MYCQNCGKENNNGNIICDECLQKQSQPSTQPQGEQKTGFGKALACTIVSNVALVVMVYAFIVYAFGFSLKVSDAGGEGLILFGITFFLASTAAEIVSLVFGIASIKRYKQIKKEGKKNPLATLILGIIGTATAGEGLVASLILMFYMMILQTALFLAI